MPYITYSIQQFRAFRIHVCGFHASGSKAANSGSQRKLVDEEPAFRSYSEEVPDKFFDFSLTRRGRA